MFPWLAALVIGVVLLALVGGVVRCLPYWCSPEGRWALRVWATEAAARRRIVAEQRELVRLKARREREERILHVRAFSDLLASIPVSELEAYPGIGPVTVSKVRGAGYATLADLQDPRIRIPGLGEKRLTDVGHAVNDLFHQALSRFQAGTCPQAYELADRLRQLVLDHGEAEARAEARLRSAEAVLQELEVPTAAARRLTWWRFLRRQAAGMVPAALLETALPDLERAVRAADEKVRDTSAGRTVVVRPESPAAPASPNGVISSPAPTEPHLAIAELVIQFGFAVARTDGSRSGKERAVIEEFLNRHFAGDAVLQNRIGALCAHYESAAIDVGACLSRLTEHVGTFDRRALVEFAARIAAASGPPNEREVKFLERVARHWDIAWQGQGGAPPEDRPVTQTEPLAVLEIDPLLPLSADLVRRQCHLLQERYAPERVEGLGPDFIALAKRKQDEVTAAARALLEPLGEPLEKPAPAAPADLRENHDLDAVFGV